MGNMIEGVLFRWEKPVKLGFRPANLADALVAASGISSVRSFMDPDLREDPLFPLVRSSALSIFADVPSRVFVTSDYDVDGTASASMLARIFRILGSEVRSFVPDRFEHSYGVNYPVLQEAFEREPFGMLVASDCGSTELRGLSSFCAERGIRCVVIDHHKRGAENDAPVYEVNPQLFLEKGVPEHGYSTSVLILLLAVHLAEENPKIREIIPTLEILAGLSALADSVSMGDIASRYAAKRFLSGCLGPHSPLGLRCLAKTGGLEGEISSADANFKIVPMINVAGRLKQADVILALLESDDADRCEAVCARLAALNVERRSLQIEIEKEALASYEDGAQVLIDCRKNWHPGVVGPAAGHVAESLGIPVFLGGYMPNKDCFSFSGRSGGTCDIHAMMVEAAAGLPVSFGGHSVAMGLKIAAQDIGVLGELRKKMSNLRIGPASKPIGKIARILNPSSVNIHNWNQIRSLEPFGPGNPSPLFCVPYVEVKLAPMNGSRVNASGSAVDTRPSDGVRTAFPLLVFRNEQLAGIRHFKGHVVGEFLLSKFRGQEILKFSVKDLIPQG